MADATIAFDALQSFEVHAELAAQIPFDHVLAILNGVNDLRELLLVEVLGADGRVNLGFRKNLPRIDRPNAVNIAERDIDPFLTWNINT